MTPARAYSGDMADELIHDTERHRYLMRRDGALITAADYVQRDNSIAFTHTFTDPKLRGKGFADQLVTFAVDDIENTTPYRVVPMCAYVAKWFEDHPERASLLTR